MEHNTPSLRGAMEHLKEHHEAKHHMVGQHAMGDKMLEGTACKGKGHKEYREGKSMGEVTNRGRR